MWLFTRHGFYSIAVGNTPDGSIDPISCDGSGVEMTFLHKLQDSDFRRLRQCADWQNCCIGITVYRLVVAKELWVEVRCGRLGKSSNVVKL